MKTASLQRNGNWSALISRLVMQVFFVQLSWLYQPIEVNLYSWQDSFHLHRPPPASPNLPLIFRVYISCQSGFCNDLHLPWFLESGQKLGRFEWDKLDFPNGVTCEEPVMPSGARQAAALWCAVAAFCMFRPGRCWCRLTLYCFVTFFVWTEESGDKKLNLARLAVAAS